MNYEVYHIPTNFTDAGRVKGNLQQHIFAQLKYELLNCKAAFRLCGMTGAPRGFQKSDIISLDIVSENSELHEQLLAA